MLVSFLAKYGDTAAKYLWERDVLEHKEPKKNTSQLFIVKFLKRSFGIDLRVHRIFRLSRSQFLITDL